jgi:hypothetical protein
MPLTVVLAVVDMLLKTWTAHLLEVPPTEANI